MTRQEVLENLYEVWLKNRPCPEQGLHHLWMGRKTTNWVCFRCGKTRKRR